MKWVRDCVRLNNLDIMEINILIRTGYSYTDKSHAIQLLKYSTKHFTTQRAAHHVFNFGSRKFQNIYYSGYSQVAH